MTDLVSRLRHAATTWPDRPAWTFDLDDGSGRTLSFAEVDAESTGLAGALQALGVREGDRVAVMLANRPELPLLWLALAKLGAALVPVNPRYRTVDTAHLVDASRAVAVVSDAAHLPLLAEVAHVPSYDVDALVPRAPRDLPEPDAERVVNVQFTSGTTGAPKGCLLPHRYWTTLADSLVDGFPHLGADDVMLTAQAFTYVDPQWNVAAALTAGAHLVVLDGFHPSTFWSKVREHGVTYFYCLAAMPTLLLRQPPDPADRDHRVRRVQCSAIPPALHAELEERWGAPWYECFGMTETGADIRVDEDHDELVGSGCLGSPAPHREVRVVDGELQLRGPGMMQGYDGLPSPFDDGWFATGDLARLDEHGRVYLVGRKKDMIRRSGENVAAQEVEAVLTSHPAVRLAAVLGVPDEVRGEEVKAFVVGDVGEEELRVWCAERLAPFKVPRYWDFRDDLPRTASERVAKELLR